MNQLYIDSTIKNDPLAKVGYIGQLPSIDKKDNAAYQSVVQQQEIEYGQCPLDPLHCCQKPTRVTKSI